MNNSIIVVNIENGPVLIPETKIGNFTLQECLANAENGTCIIPTSEERKLEIHFHEQIDVEPLTNMECIETPQMVNETNILRYQEINPNETFESGRERGYYTFVQEI